MKRIILTIALIISILTMTLPMSGCVGGMSTDEIISMLKEWLAENQEDEEDEEDAKAVITLTYPAGRSPNVFTTGWVFGARATVDGKDYSEQVTWSGTGSFNPDTGTRSRPSFDSEGSNTITLSVKIKDKEYSKSFTVNAVSPDGYACVGMKAYCPADAHGSPGDPLPVIGPITTGSPNVRVNGSPAARVGDSGVHAACAGANTFTIATGDSSVLIDGKPAALIKLSQTRHCGGMGTIVGYGK